MLFLGYIADHAISILAGDATGLHYRVGVVAAISAAAPVQWTQAEVLARRLTPEGTFLSGWDSAASRESFGSHWPHCAFGGRHPSPPSSVCCGSFAGVGLVVFGKLMGMDGIPVKRPGRLPQYSLRTLFIVVTAARHLAGIRDSLDSKTACIFISAELNLRIQRHPANNA